MCHMTAFDVRLQMKEHRCINFNADNNYSKKTLLFVVVLPIFAYISFILIECFIY